MAVFSSYAQQPTKEELQRRTQDLTREIEELKANIEKNGKNKEKTMAFRLQLSRKIDARNQIIQNIKGEVYYIEKDIIRNYREIDTLKKELDTLKAQYAKSIVYAYKNRSNYDFLNFLFSAGTFNDALRRIAYLKNYRNYREQQAGQIKKTNELLAKKVESLTGKRQDKGKALIEQGRQMEELANDKKQQDNALAGLQKTEKELGSAMQKKQKQKQEVARAIKKIVDAQIAAQAMARKVEAARLAKIEKDRVDAENKLKGTQPVNPNNPPIVKIEPVKPAIKEPKEPRTFEESPEAHITSMEFEKNRGNLPWPVDQSTITFRYGRNVIPAKPRDLIENRDGVTLETGIGASVKSIFDGEITSVENISGQVLVIVKHGKYLSAYAGLSNATVSKGDKISLGQVIGKAGTNDDNVGEVELLITNDRGTYLDPLGWLKRR